ncbi:glycoside hydrolase domain-containing protein [Luteimicrobium album]|nr:glycoside hydrolase domain-containing protein [Luteimicrobium album]
MTALSHEGSAPTSPRTLRPARLRRAVLPAAIALVTSAAVVPLAGPASAAPAKAATDYTQYVNPFIGTEGDHGQDGPGAFAPYGLATVTPTTTNGNHVGYEYTSDTLLGFTNVALDGVGGGGGAGDVLVVPTYQSYTSRPSTSSYQKDIRTKDGAKDESATAGSYQVGLDESGKDIDAQVTAATRTGVHDYAFDSAGHASLVVDLQHTGNGRRATDLKVGTISDGRATLSGSFTGYFYNSAYKLYYYAETTVPTSSVQTWGAGGLSSTKTSQDGTDIGAVLNFDATAGEHVGLRVTLSPVSAAQAKRDAAVEVGGKTFDQVRSATKAEWNDRLGKVDVDASTTNDPTGDLKTEFYTHLYRLADTPMNATSTDGTYRGADGVIYHADGYTHYDSWSLWDDFHKYAAVASVYPDVYRDVVQSLVDLYAEVGTSGKGVGSLLQSVPTVRWERAPVVVADAVSKGSSSRASRRPTRLSSRRSAAPPA